MYTKSSTAIDEPRVVTPYVDIMLPMREKERRLNELPHVMKSSKLAVDPKRAKP
jgi:hypothetical protein